MIVSMVKVQLVELILIIQWSFMPRVVLI
ncbi:hypothetical protein A2U01_0108334, partial [Trifolium medium]|nr:hypothetical protein [Trifolium medium]